MTKLQRVSLETIMLNKIAEAFQLPFEIVIMIMRQLNIRARVLYNNRLKLPRNWGWIRHGGEPEFWTVPPFRISDIRGTRMNIQRRTNNRLDPWNETVDGPYAPKPFYGPGY